MTLLTITNPLSKDDANRKFEAERVVKRTNRLWVCGLFCMFILSCPFGTVFALNGHGFMSAVMFVICIISCAILIVAKLTEPNNDSVFISEKELSDLQIKIKENQDQPAALFLAKVQQQQRDLTRSEYELLMKRQNDKIIMDARNYILEMAKEQNKNYQS